MFLFLYPNVKGELNSVSDYSVMSRNGKMISGFQSFGDYLVLLSRRYRSDCVFDTEFELFESMSEHSLVSFFLKNRR